MTENKPYDHANNPLSGLSLDKTNLAPELVKELKALGYRTVESVWEAIYLSKSAFEEILNGTMSSQQLKAELELLIPKNELEEMKASLAKIDHSGSCSVDGNAAVWEAQKKKLSMQDGVVEVELNKRETEDGRVKVDFVIHVKDLKDAAKLPMQYAGNRVFPVYHRSLKLSECFKQLVEKEFSTMFSSEYTELLYLPGVLYVASSKNHPGVIVVGIEDIEVIDFLPAIHNEMRVIATTA
jgi:hypothetical protein